VGTAAAAGSAGEGGGALGGAGTVCVATSADAGLSAAGSARSILTERIGAPSSVVSSLGAGAGFGPDSSSGTSATTSTTRMIAPVSRSFIDVSTAEL
jgi:hypothetical protein